MKTEIARLSDEETRQYRLLGVKLESLERNPTAYSAQETEDIIRRRHTFWQEMTDKHGLGSINSYTVDWSTGVLIESDE